MFFGPLPLKKYLIFLFWWLLPMTATPQLMLNRKRYQASKPELEFHMINMIYAALSMRTQTEKTTLSCKDNCTLTKHTRRWTYSALRYFLSNQSIIEGLQKREIPKWNMPSAMCAFSIYRHLCMKMSSFLCVRTWTMPRILCLSCEIPFPV